MERSRGTRDCGTCKEQKETPVTGAQTARKRVVQDGTLELDRGLGLQDFITHSQETGLNHEGSGGAN